jgi:hypothetical protein
MNKPPQSASDSSGKQEPEIITKNDKVNGNKTIDYGVKPDIVPFA